jgi:hypothetical protein
VVDTVEEVWLEVIAVMRIAVATTVESAVSPQVEAIGAGTGIAWRACGRFGRWRKVELVVAPFGPRNRNRSGFRMRFS